MPIVIHHQPNAALFARTGYVAGAGQYLQRLQEMRQRERMQIRGLQYNQMSQQMAQANRSYQLALNRQDRINADQKRQEFQREMGRIQHNNNVDLKQMELNARKNREIDVLARNRQEADQMHWYTGQINNMLEDWTKAAAAGTLTPEQEIEYGMIKQQLRNAAKNNTAHEIDKLQRTMNWMEQHRLFPEEMKPEDELRKKIVPSNNPTQQDGQIVTTPQGKEQFIPGGPKLDTSEADADFQEKNAAQVEAQLDQMYPAPEFDAEFGDQKQHQKAMEENRAVKDLERRKLTFGNMTRYHQGQAENARRLGDKSAMLYHDRRAIEAYITMLGYGDLMDPKRQDLIDEYEREEMRFQAEAGATRPWKWALKAGLRKHGIVDEKNQPVMKEEEKKESIARPGRDEIGKRISIEE